jgi:hypothetical protein
MYRCVDYPFSVMEASQYVDSVSTEESRTAFIRFPRGTRGNVIWPSISAVDKSMSSY